MNKFKLLGLSSLLIISASTQSQANEIRPVIAMGYDTGGDTLAKVNFTNGSSNEITAGSGLVFSGGIYAPLGDDTGFQATIGYKFDSVNAQNGTIDFTRIPIDLLVFKHFGETHSIAAGITYHMSPSFTCSVSGVCNSTVNFDNAVGYIAEYDYSFSSNNQSGMKLGLRYTGISYDTSTINQSFDGSSIGLIFYLY